MCNENYSVANENEGIVNKLTKYQRFFNEESKRLFVPYFEFSNFKVQSQNITVNPDMMKKKTDLGSLFFFCR